MFTGIIEKTATIESFEKGELVLRSVWGAEEIVLGQSIAVDGCCLTVAKIQNASLYFQLSTETIGRTGFRFKKQGDAVNVERSLRLGDRMDGHMVTGHVDALAKITAIETHADGVSKKITLEIPGEYQPWIVSKGSITLDGVSLTVNEVSGKTFSVTIIPHTMQVTTWKAKKTGDAFNAEFDVIAKYVDRILTTRTQEIAYAAQ